FDIPVDAVVGGIGRIPGKAFEEVVVRNGNVVGVDADGEGGVGAAEDDIFAGGFEEVVGDEEVAGAIVAGDGLGIGAVVVDVGDVAIGDGGVSAIKFDARLIVGVAGGGDGIPAV